MLQNAINWIHQFQLNGQGIAITNKQLTPYPEVSGYYIPTLLAIGETSLAEQFARSLVNKQNANGAFSLHDPSVSYVFDTGQIIRGWVSIIDRLPELTEPLVQACNWIVNGADAQGRLLHPAPGGDWSLGDRGEVNEAIHLYVIKPLLDAGKILGLPHITQAAERAKDYYLKNTIITNFTLPNSLTHFYAYIQEALFELGCDKEVTSGMNAVSGYQQNNGAIPGYHNVTWVCSTGLAQLAKVWYLMGDCSRADLAMTFLAQLQNGSGGFYGSYGVHATYFPTEEISWAVKYAIDAEQLRIEHHFNQTAHFYAPTISLHDDRVKTILAELNDAQCILDAGCGKGRYSTLIKHHFPQIEVHAVDVADTMLQHIPSSIHTAKASIQSLPYPDAKFDVIFCVEALEHAANPDAAIQEMERALKPGGRLIIIDKNIALSGTLETAPWEKWFDINSLAATMQKLNLTTQAKYIGYDGKDADGLFVAWIGNKPAAILQSATERA